MKKINISICQSIEEIKFIIKKIKTDKDILWIPLNLETFLYFKKKNFNYIDLSKYFTSSDHKKGISESEKFLKTFKFLTNTIETRTKGILRKFFNSIFLIITIISKIEKDYKINKFVLSGWSSFNFLSRHRNYFISNIVFEIYKKKYNIKTINKLNAKSKNYFDIYQYFFDENINKLKNYILFTNTNYNFLRIMKCFINKKKKVVILDFSEIGLIKKFILKFIGIKIFSIQKKFFNKQQIKKKLISKYKYRGFHFEKIINYRYQQILNETLDLGQKKILIDNFLKVNIPKLVITNTSRGVDGLICEVAKRLKIKTVSISHGTIAKGFNFYDKLYHSNMSEELISNSHKYFCSQSKIAKNFIKSSQFKSKNLNTGNLIFAEVRKKSNKFLLYAVTARDFVNMHFLGCETFFEIFKDLQKLNDIANRKKLNVLIKLHPNISYLKNELSKEFFFLNFSNEKIEKLLRETNATLSFSSTTIEDSLCSKIPVILIDQWLRFQHCVAEKNLSKKNKAVYYINDIEDLPKVVKNINSSKRINFHDYTFGNNINFNIKELTKKLLQ